jgi:hypothetical protein
MSTLPPLTIMLVLVLLVKLTVKLALLLVPPIVPLLMMVISKIPLLIILLFKLVMPLVLIVKITPLTPNVKNVLLLNIIPLNFYLLLPSQVLVPPVVPLYLKKLSVQPVLPIISKLPLPHVLLVTLLVLLVLNLMLITNV